MENVIQHIPLDKLEPSPQNVRQTARKDGIAELAENIARNGLLQSLSVKAIEDKPGHYRVCGGGRRLAALKSLARQRRIERTAPVPCILAQGDEEEASLAENEMRLSLHPADAFDAMSRLHARGLSAEDIAARFGVSPHVVRQRLKLAAVSPKILKLYRKGDLSLEHVMAFAVTDDHARQEEVYAAHRHDEPHWIRRVLLEESVRSEDRRVRFVGIEAYTNAGGAVVRDLFSNMDDGVYLADPALLNQLVQDKLEKTRAEIASEGWLWVEAYKDRPYSFGHRRVFPYDETEYLDDLDAAETLDGEIDDLRDLQTLDSAAQAKLSELERTKETLAAKMAAYPADVIASTGALVTMDWEGKLVIERGLVRADAKERTTDGFEATEAAAKKSEFSDGLVRDLTARRTLALRLELGDRPDVALLALTHALAAQAFRCSPSMHSPLEIGFASPVLRTDADGIDDTANAAALRARHSRWEMKLKLGDDDESGGAGLWTAISNLSSNDRPELLAHCVGLTLYAVRGNRAYSDDNVLAAIEAASGFDMADHWEATAEGYFDRVTKTKIAEAVAEAASPEDAARLAPLKKTEMAREAERLVKDKRWLPPFLRFEASPHEESQA